MKKKTNHWTSVLAVTTTALLLAGCVSTPTHPDVPPARAEAEFNNLVQTGRIISRIALPGSKTHGTAENSVIFVGGRAYLTKGASSGRQLLEASYLYDIELPGDISKRARVVVAADYSIGSCVDIKTVEPPPQDKLVFPGGEAVLLPSAKCSK